MPRMYIKRETVEMRVRVDPTIYEGLKDRSATENRSLNSIMERVLAQALNRWATAKKEA